MQHALVLNWFQDELLSLNEIIFTRKVVMTGDYFSFKPQVQNASVSFMQISIRAINFATIYKSISRIVRPIIPGYCGRVTPLISVKQNGSSAASLYSRAPENGVSFHRDGDLVDICRG